VGEVRVERACGYCRSCRRTVTGVDRWSGLERDSLTPRGRRLVVLAGTDHSFDQASDRLWEYCGIRISDQTVRRACDKAGEAAQAYLEAEPAAVEQVEAAKGECELTMDGAKVNTTDGWREIRGMVVCKREKGEPAGVRQWKGRALPEPRARVAWALIADSETVGEQIGRWAKQLNWGRGTRVSVLGDGIPWIWTQSRAHLPDHEGCLDVWHLMEHLHQAGRKLHGEGEQARRWAELQRAKLFRYGAARYLKQHLLPQLKTERRAAPDGEAAEALRSLFLYLYRHRRRMNYRDRLRRGLPIGSGQIEGVCKNTLNRRLRKNSPRWRPKMAVHIAALCCLHTSDLWDQFWKHAA
jgi:hypothetical protein